MTDRNILEQSQVEFIEQNSRRPLMEPNNRADAVLERGEGQALEDLASKLIDQILMSYGAKFLKPKMVEIIMPLLVAHERATLQRRLERASALLAKWRTQANSNRDDDDRQV